MDTKQVAEKLVALCKEGKNIDAVNELYSKDIVSIEASTPPGMPKEQKGIDAIRKKNEWWFDNTEVHSVDIQGPFVNDDRFSVLFDYDVTMKGQDKRTKMKEIGIYDVKDGKVAREEFLS